MSRSKMIGIAKNDTELARELKTTRRTLHRWRKQHADCPKTRDVHAWLTFMAHHALRPGQAFDFGKLLGRTSEKNTGPCTDEARQARIRWERRRETLFDVIELVHEARAFDVITPAAYAEIAAGTAAFLVQIGKLWRAEIDGDRFIAAHGTNVPL